MELLNYILKMKERYVFIGVILFIFTINLIYAEEFGYNLLEVGKGLNPDTNISKKDVNSSKFWDTASLGPLRDANSTQFDNANSQVLNIQESWIGLFDTNASTGCSDGEYLDGEGFCLNFNDTVESIATSIYYNATQSQAVAGTIDAGTIVDTQHQDANYDGTTFNFSETAGTPGLDLRINFTNITSFNQGVMRYKTSSLAGDYPIIQLWNYGTSEWEDYPEVAESLSFATITQPVFDATEHLQDGVVQMRIYKASNGNINNHYYIDWIAIIKGFGTPAGEETDPLSIHRDGNISLTGNWSFGDFLIEGSYGEFKKINLTNNISQLTPEISVQNNTIATKNSTLCLGFYQGGNYEQLCYRANNGWTTIWSPTGQSINEYDVNFKQGDDKQFVSGITNDVKREWETTGSQDYFRYQLHCGSATQSCAFIIGNQDTWYGRDMPQQYFDYPTFGIHSGRNINEETLYSGFNGSDFEIRTPQGKSGIWIVGGNGTYVNNLSVSNNITIGGTSIADYYHPTTNYKCSSGTLGDNDVYTWACCIGTIYENGTCSEDLGGYGTCSHTICDGLSTGFSFEGGGA